MKIVFTLLVLMAASCQTAWDRYDESLYASVFEPSPSTYENHIRSLEALAATDPPPPGLCAELAYYLVLAEREDEAHLWLDRELEHWPESVVIVSALHKFLVETPIAEAGGEKQ